MVNLFLSFNFYVDMRAEYQQPYNSIATEAFSILDDSELQTETVVRR